MKCLYIITEGNLGGAQVHLLDLISNTKTVVEAEVVMGSKGWLWDELRNKGTKVHFAKTLVREICPIQDFLCLIHLVRIIRSSKPDLVHCHSSKAGFLGRIASKICGVPVIFTAHGWAFTDGVAPRKKLVYLLLEKLMAGLTDRIICVSEYDGILGKQAMPQYRDKMVVIHNGIPQVDDVDFVVRNKDKQLKLIMVARFSEPKNQQLLLNALAGLQEVNIYFKTSLVGDGPLFNTIHSRAEELGLLEAVDFLGARTDVDRLIIEHDVFVLTTNWEGFPISILEAMRRGLPIIASDVGGVREAVVDGINGFLVPRDNMASLMDKLSQLNNDRELLTTFSINSRQIYKENFTVDKMVKRTLEIYCEVLRARSVVRAMKLERRTFF